MAISTEAIVSIAGVFINLPSAILALWRLFEGRNARPSAPSGTKYQNHDAITAQQLTSVQVVLRNNLSKRPVPLPHHEPPFKSTSMRRSGTCHKRDLERGPYLLELISFESVRGGRLAGIGALLS
jgi:hypothetical protein